MEKSIKSEETFGIHEWIKTLQYLVASGFFSGLMWTYLDPSEVVHPILYYAVFPLPGIGFCLAIYLILKWIPNKNFSFVSFCILTNLVFLFSVFFFAISADLVEHRFFEEAVLNFIPQNVTFPQFLRFFIILSVSSFVQIKIIESTTKIKLQIRYVFSIALISGFLAVSVFLEDAGWLLGVSDFFRLEEKGEKGFYLSNLLSIRFVCFVWTLIHGCMAVVFIWVGDDGDEEESEFLHANSNS